MTDIQRSLSTLVDQVNDMAEAHKIQAWWKIISGDRRASDRRNK